MVSPSLAQSQLSAKRAHRKSRAGCKNCKARHVKCDERKPLCTNCERHYTGLTACEWDLISETSPAPPTSRKLRRLTSGASRSRRGTSTPSSQPLSAAGSRYELFNPFESLQIPESLPNDDLLNFYHTKLVYRMFPFFSNPVMIEAWWTIMSSDPLLTQTALSLTALQVERRLGRTNDYRSIELTFGCVNLLQQRIRDEAEASSDQMLMAISQLIAIENDTGSMRTVRLHTQALQSMVRLRGGLDIVASSSTIAASMVFWNTMAASTEPSMLPCLFDEAVDPPSWFRTTSDSVPTNLLQYGIDAGISNWMQASEDLYEQIGMLSKLTDQLKGYALVVEICRTIQRLVTYELSPSTTPSIQWFLTDACRQATVLYILLAPQKYFPGPQLFMNALVHGLKRSLVLSFRYFDSHEDNLLLIWTLCVGCVASWHLQERRWFVEYLAFALDSTAIRTEEELRTALAHIMAFHTFREFSTLGVWAELDALLSKT